MSSLHNPAPAYATPRNTARKTLGGAVGRVMAALSNPPMPWQQDFLAVACEIDPETGLFWYQNIVLILPRQGGKTSVSRGKMTHRAMTTADGLMLYTAQDRNKARKRLEKNFYNPIKGSPLGQYLNRPRWQAGSEAVRWGNGAELGIDAVGRKTGHGDTLHEAHVDEAYAHRDTSIEQGIKPSLITVTGSQMFVLSAAGDLDAAYLLRKAEVGRALVTSGRESRTMYWEFAAPLDADPSDPQTALSAHPAITHTISLQTVMDDILTATDPEDAYRAYYSWWPKAKAPDRVIPTELWENTYADEDAVLWNGTPFWTVDTDPDREWSAIGMAAKSNDPKARCYLECLDRQLGTAWVVKTLVELRSRFGGNQVAVDANGAAKSLRKDLEAEGFEVILMTGPQRVDACGGFFDDVIDGRLRILNTDDLNHAAANVAKLKSGDAFIWGRPKSLADITALYSVTIARWLYMEKSADDYNAGDSVL
ncbi:hypothetical protein ACX80O_02320 [Arthrobacter sp. Hz1]